MKRKIMSFITAAVMTVGVISMVSPPVAQAAELDASVVEYVKFTNRSGEELSGQRLNNFGVQNMGGFDVRIKVNFPDDAQPGDTVTVSLNEKIGLATNTEIMAQDSEGRNIAKLTTGMKDGKQTYMLTLEEGARDLNNRSALAVVSSTLAPFSCRNMAISSLSVPIKASVNNEQIENTTNFSANINWCSSTNIPRPYPVSSNNSAHCIYYNPGQLKYENVYNRGTVNQRLITNVLVGVNDPIITIAPSKTPYATELYGTIEMNAKTGGVSKLFSVYDQDKDVFIDNIQLRTVPIMWKEYEGRRYADAHLALPSAYLFPTAEIAQEFKNYVVSTYGEDAYDNTNGAFHSLSDSTKNAINNKARDLSLPYIKERVELISYNKEEAAWEFKIKDIGRLTSPVNIDGEPLQDKVDSRSSRYEISFNIGKYVFAPYLGPGEYGVPQISFRTDGGQQTEGRCIGERDLAIANISGVGYGDPNPIDPKFEVSKEATTDKVYLKKNGEFTVNYNVTASNIYAFTGTLTDIMDTPSLPEGFTIREFSSNGTVIESDGSGRYALSNSETLRPEESKTFNITIKGVANVDLRDSESMRKVSTCNTEGTGDPQQGLFNSVSASKDTDANNNDACITAHYVDGPVLEVEKLINGEDVDSAPGTKLKPGQDMTITYEVRNTGDAPAYEVSIIDEVVEGKTKDSLQQQILDELAKVEKFTLAPGESHTVDITVNAPHAYGDQHKNVAKAVGIPPREDDPNTPDPNLPKIESPEDPAHVSTSGLPKIDTTKFINNQDANTQEEAVKIGLDEDMMKVTIVATNTGDVPLSQVTVTDDTYVNNSIKESDFMVYGASGESLGSMKNGEISLNPGDYATVEVMVDAPKNGENHVNTVLTQGTPHGDDVPTPDDWGYEDYPKIVEDSDPAHAVRPERPKESTPPETTTETTTRTTTIRKTETTTTPVEKVTTSTVITTQPNKTQTFTTVKTETMYVYPKVNTGGRTVSVLDILGGVFR